MDFAAITANTPHLVFDELAARSPLPLLSLVEVCADEARRRGLAPFAAPRNAVHDGGAVLPRRVRPQRHRRRGAGGDERSWVHARYIGELLKGEFRDGTRKELVALVARLRDEQAIEAVILGGTELPLLLRDSTIAGVPALDTTALHVAAIVERLGRDAG